MKNKMLSRLEGNKTNLSSRQFVGRDLPHPLLLGQEEKQPCFTRDVEDPRQRPSGMTFVFYNDNSMGFTLIELLVVVLIIGILAAVALPKYQLAVAKARYMQLISLANALHKGQEVYKMANGEYASDISALDIELPAGTAADSGTVYYTWGWCGTGSSGYAHCENAQDGVAYNDLGSVRQCKALPGAKQEFGKKVCQSFGAVGGSADSYGYLVYEFQ